MPGKRFSMKKDETPIKKPGVRDRKSSWLIPLTVISGIIGVLFIVMVFVNNELRFYLLSASFLLAFIIGSLSISNLLTVPEWVKIYLFTFSLEISIVLLASVYLSFSGLPYAIIAIAIGFILSSLLPRSNASDYLLMLGIIGAISSYMVSVLAPLPQIESPAVAGIIGALSIFFVLITISLFLRNVLVATLGTKLMLGSLALTLIPLAIISGINNRYLQTAIQEQSNQSLTVAADQTARSLDEFISSRLDSLVNESSLPAISAFVSLEPNLRANSTEEVELVSALRSLQTKEKIYLPSYAVLDIAGQNLYDTESANIGLSEQDTSYFKNSSSSAVGYVSSVEFPPNTREAYINFINPIKNESSAVIGYLRARYNARILQDNLKKNIGLVGNRSYPILLDDNGLRIADGFSPNLIYHAVVQYSPEEYSRLLSTNRLPSFIPEQNISNVQTDLAGAITQNQSSRFFTTSLNVQGKEILHSGTVSRLVSQPWSVIYLQDQANLTSALVSQNKISSTIASIIAGIVGVLITIVANLFSAPIIRLTKAAEQITTGNFDVQAKVTSNDEIGILGNSFNSMTGQLKGFIDTLENRVRERTQKLAEQNESLQFRSRQLQTVSDVARSIVSTRELDTLLTSVTKLVSERFDFYHAGIFLIDESGENAVLRAANSEGGRRMLERQHRLKVGQVGIVGYVTGSGEPRIATDVGDDAVFFNNPDLPDTKSEMALPLKLGSRVIGALDVQSTVSNAFSMEDIELFTTLADQIAIAINNSQLYEETSKALEESQNLYRQYLHQEWTRQSLEGGSKNYKYTPEGLVPYDEDLPEINMVLNTARPVFRTKKSVEQNSTETHSVMAVPIILGGESIGAIYLQETSSNNYVWSQSELSTVQAVADQVAQSLENSRLFEQTIRRADRERKVLEITSKIRSTNDPQEMLMITLEELKRNLGVNQAQIVLNLERQTISGANVEKMNESEKVNLPESSN